MYAAYDQEGMLAYIFLFRRSYASAELGYLELSPDN